MTPVLQGIRVLDFGRYIAGPYCAALLGDLGAEVIRIDKVDGSEDRFVAPVTDEGEGALFLQMNRNKRSLTLDPTGPEGREVVRRLVASADVVVANLPGPTLKAMGLDDATLRAIRPDLVLVTSSAFGDQGPMSRWVGFDGVAQAMSGAVYMTGQPDQPYRAAVNWVDFGTALHCAFGALAALMERSRSGQGQQVSGSLLATALTFTNSTLIEQAVRQTNRVASGNRGQTAAPVDLYRCTDGWLLCQVVGQPLFERWARLVGVPEWLDDPRFASDLSRGEHGELISARMQAWCEPQGLQQALLALGEARIPCGPVLSPQQSLDHPQVQALSLLQPMDYPGLPHPAPVAAVPITMSAHPRQPPRPAPRLGEHTDTVLAGLGYSVAEIEGLRSRGVV